MEVLFSLGKLCGGTYRSPWVKVELSFNLVEGQLYLLTYVNEYRGGPLAKTHTESVSHCSSGVPEWKEKRDVAKSGEYLQPYAPCIICGIYESFWYNLGKCAFPFSAKWVITRSLCSCLAPLTSYPCRSCPSSSDTTAAARRAPRMIS